MGDIESLRGRLRASEKTLLDKFSDRVRHVEQLRPIFGFVAVAGALIAALARAVPGVWGVGLTVAGAVVGSAGGALVVLMDFKKLEISQDAKDAHRTADEAIQALATKALELDAATALAEEAVLFDRKRLARIEATRLMIESVEAAFLSSADAQRSAMLLLQNAIFSLRNAVDYRAGDFLTFTIFQKVKRGRVELMQPIAREWTDVREAANLGRSWKRGEGFTGSLWSLAHDNRKASVVEPDTQKPEAHRYKVDSADPERERRYRSVASFPILVGRENEIWGVVTATSDRPGVFDHTGDLARQSVETVRDIALVASLLAKLRPS